MSTEPQVICHCGHRILRRDVLQEGRFLRLNTPGFVYIKYRCSHCKRVGERLLAFDEYEAGALMEIPAETSREERLRFARLGPIELDEVIDFHYELDGASLEDLRHGGD